MPFTNLDAVQSFFGKVYQWRVGIALNLRMDGLSDEVKKMFHVKANLKMVTHMSKSFDLLRLGYFDRVSRHQIVLEVARFVQPFFGIACGDLEHNMQLVQMLLTMHGGVEMAILLIHQVELSYHEIKRGLQSVLE